MNTKLLNGIAIGLLAASAGCETAVAPDMTEAGDSFSGVRVLHILQAQGETRIERSDNDQVSVQYNFTYPESCHQAGLIQSGDTLEIRGLFEPVACSGRADISIWVPDGVVIEYFGAQAYLILEGVAVEIVAYGQSVVARELALTGESSLFAHSRDVVVSVAESPAFSLEVLSHDANVILNAEGHTLRGRFEFAVSEEHGEIVSPYSFDEEVRYDCQCEPGVTWWLRKAFTLDSAYPVIRLSTRDGVAELKLD